MTTDVSIINMVLYRVPSSQRFACVPLGPLYLCAALEGAGYSVDFYDYQLTENANPYSPQSICSHLFLAQSNLIGISCMTNMLPFLLIALQEFKKKRPDSFVVLGGAGPSGVAIEILTRFPQVDAVVTGEGEEAIIEIIQAMRGSRQWASIAGLSYNIHGNIRSNRIRHRNKNIDQIALPAYHLLGPTRHHYMNAPVLTSRGCPYRCTFCDISPNWDRYVVYRNLNCVISEAEEVSNYFGTRSISIIDDVFTLTENRVIEFCNTLINNGKEYEWSCLCRTDLLNEKMMDLMYRAGFKGIFLGVESGSRKIRKFINKELAFENVEKVIAKASSRFDVVVSFILGFPFESLEDFKETIWLSTYTEILGAKPQITILSPMPQATLTLSQEYELVFDPYLISGMVFPGRHQTLQPISIMHKIMTPVIQNIIKSEPKIFSAFYHFKKGRVREKLEMAMEYGLPWVFN